MNYRPISATSVLRVTLLSGPEGTFGHVTGEVQRMCVVCPWNVFTAFCSMFHTYFFNFIPIIAGEYETSRYLVNCGLFNGSAEANRRYCHDITTFPVATPSCVLVGETNACHYTALLHKILNVQLIKAKIYIVTHCVSTPSSCSVRHS